MGEHTVSFFSVLPLPSKYQFLLSHSSRDFRVEVCGVDLCVSPLLAVKMDFTKQRSLLRTAKFRCRERAETGMLQFYPWLEVCAKWLPRADHQSSLV